MTPFARAVLDFGTARALFSLETGILVALSGGADSCALLLALNEARQAGLLPDLLGAIHVHHGLRGAAADDDAAFCAALCDSLGLKFLKRQAHLATSANESDARSVRYRLLIDAAHTIGADTIATAHTADDQAETVLLRILRGTSVDGLVGIPAERILAPGLRVVRPLLAQRRSQIEAYCRSHAVRPRHDPTNDDPRFPRNRVRRLLPELSATFNPRLVEALGRLAENARHEREESAIDASALRLFEHAVTDDGVALTLSVPALRAVSVALRRRTLYRALLRIGGHHGGTEALATARWVDCLDALVAESGAFDLPGRLRACREGDVVRIAPVPPLAEGAAFAVPLAIPGITRTGTVAVRATWGKRSGPRDGALSLGLPPGVTLTLRSARPGDRIAPPGMGGHTKSVRRILAEARVPVADRAGWPVLVRDDSGEILWIVGHVLADAALNRTVEPALYLDADWAPV
jgi:tRNA(Ile)-lysidine synthase